MSEQTKSLLSANIRTWCENIKDLKPHRLQSLADRAEELEAERSALLRERDEAVRLLGQITGQVRTLPGNTEIGFDFVMLLKRIDGFLSTQGSNTETTHPSPQSDILTTLPLSITEEQIERIGREQYPPDTTNDGEPWYSHEQATRNMYFKDGLRYASTHTKTITVDQIVEVAKRSRKCMRCSGEGRFYDPSGSCRWADCADCHGNGSDLHELLTSKFK